MFLQATPGVARMLSHPSAFDYAKVEEDRLAIAKMGIELEAEYVFDIAGKVVHNQFIAGGINQTIGTLDLQNLANGIYILQATSNGSKTTARLVIQK